MLNKRASRAMNSVERFGATIALLYKSIHELCAPLFFSFRCYSLVPESPTFLVFNRKPEGRSVIERIARVNKVKLSEDIFDIDIEETHSRGIKDVLYEIVMMFKDKTLALYSIIFFLNW